MKDMNEKNRITLWMVGEDYIESVYGRITYQEWCERERERIYRSGENLKIVHREDGAVALFR